jgi:hypothetical protein
VIQCFTACISRTVGTTCVRRAASPEWREGGKTEFCLKEGNMNAAKGRAAAKPGAADRVTVALVPKAAGDLQQTVERTGLSKTDVVNRALTLYQYLDALLSSGAELFTRDKSGQVEKINFF